MNASVSTLFNRRNPSSASSVPIKNSVRKVTLHRNIYRYSHRKCPLIKLPKPCSKRRKQWRFYVPGSGGKTKCEVTRTEHLGKLVSRLIIGVYRQEERPALQLPHANERVKDLADLNRKWSMIVSEKRHTAQGTGPYQQRRRRRTVCHRERLVVSLRFVLFFHARVSARVSVMKRQ